MIPENATETTDYTDSTDNRSIGKLNLETAPVWKTGLLSSRKDEKGCTKLNQTIHFGGTLQHIDETQWHDLLAKAAAPKPDGTGKDSTTAAGKK